MSGGICATEEHSLSGKGRKSPALELLPEGGSFSLESKQEWCAVESFHLLGFFFPKQGFWGKLVSQICTSEMTLEFLEVCSNRECLT